jgi:hypothetical protein
MQVLGNSLVKIYFSNNQYLNNILIISNIPGIISDHQRNGQPNATSTEIKKYTKQISNVDESGPIWL